MQEMQKTQVRSLGGEDPLEERMATHSSILALKKIPRTEEPGRLELSCFLYDPMDVGNLISGSSAFSKSSLNIWKFMVRVLLKPGLENFEHYFTSV